MKPIDRMAYLRRRREKAPRARLAAAFFILILLTGLPPASLRAQVTNMPKVDTSETTTQKIETFVERAERQGTAVHLSLKDAMRIALQNNLSIAIQDYSEEISRERIFAAQHVYDPRFVGFFGYGSSDRPNSSRFSLSVGGNAATANTLRWNGSVLQNLPYGGNWKVEYATSRSAVFPVTIGDIFSSQFVGGITFSYTQPLLKDFRNNPAFRNIKLVKLDDKINDTQFEEQVTAVTKQVQDIYWELLFAIKEQGIRKKSLELAGVQLDSNKRKVAIGTLAPIAITEASAEVAIREQAMIAAENQINSLQNSLKRALSKDRNSELWNQSLIPTEGVEIAPANCDMQESILTAIKNRPELRRAQLHIEKLDVDYKYFKDQKRPRLDFVGSFGTVGVAGTAAPPPPPDLGFRYTPPPSFFIGGVRRLTRQLFAGNFSNYTVGIQVDIPIRNRAAESQLAQLSLQRRQALKQFKDAEQMIIVEVRNALQLIQTNQKIIEMAKVGYKLAQEQYDAEQKRFQAGLSTTFFVLQRQRDLADAEGRLLRVQVDYRKSLSDLQKANFTTIDSNDMELAKSQVSANGH